jgi:hypothetical protein
VAPLLIQFVAPSSLVRETHRASALPMVRNGPPGTFVLLPEAGIRISLPTDQILSADDSGGSVRVAFGGMRFVGEEGRTLVFVRERELHPEAQLSPERSHTMRLDSTWLAAVIEHGQPVWTARAG